MQHWYVDSPQAVFHAGAKLSRRLWEKKNDAFSRFSEYAVKYFTWFFQRKFSSYRSIESRREEHSRQRYALDQPVHWILAHPPHQIRVSWEDFGLGGPSLPRVQKYKQRAYNAYIRPSRPKKNSMESKNRVLSALDNALAATSTLRGELTTPSTARKRKRDESQLMGVDMET